MGCPIFCPIWLVKKTILWLVKKTTRVKLDVFSTWLNGQIDQIWKCLVFGLVFQSNKPWFLIVIIQRENGNVCIMVLILPQANGKNCEDKLSINMCRGKNYDLICNVHGAPIVIARRWNLHNNFLRVLHTQAKF